MIEALIYILIGLAILTPLVIKFLQHRHLYPFMPFKYNFRRRRITFAKVLRLLNERKAKIIIETGTSRKGLDGTKSDGAATIVFGKWAKQHGAKMHSVDISEDSVNGSRAAVVENGLSDVVTVYLEDSLSFLERFNEQVDFLYLDSYDYSKTDTEIQHKSQVHHLEEFKLIENQLHQDTIVLIDDCGLPGGGKGKLVVEYMLERDWKILIDRYQILLVRK